MRILSLGLERFGPFTGRTLAFRPDARLHVVYGRNEAGKSSSLAAVTDLLFGIERSTAWDFQHAGKDLLLQATVVDRAGTTLTFQRRKNRPVLSAPDGAALPDDALAPYLGGVTRDVFRRAFGLDSEALRRSADELQKSDGELGAALLSAGSGLRGFTALRKELDAEADAIFAPRAGKDRRFYQAAARFEQARQQMRETETRAGALKSLRDEIAAHEDEIAKATARRSGIAVDRARIERLRRAGPIIAAIDDVQARLAALDGLPDAPEGSGTRLAKALEALDLARQARDQAAQRQQKLTRDREALQLDSAVIDHADEIERLAEEAGAYLKAQQDLPRVQADLDAAVAALDQLLADRAGGDVDLAEPVGGVRGRTDDVRAIAADDRDRPVRDQLLDGADGLGRLALVVDQVDLDLMLALRLVEDLDRGQHALAEGLAGAGDRAGQRHMRAD
ncbi:AAA family ATPase, partial [Nostoc sp. NIES-2111]